MKRPHLDFLWTIAGLCIFLSLSTLSYAQDQYDINGEQTYWDAASDTTDSSYYYYYDDDSSSYYGDDSSYYYDDDSSYYYGDDSLYYEDVGTDYQGSDYTDENGSSPEGGLTDVELADQARKMGYTVTFAGSSPGYVSHTLTTYNSKTDFRIGVEFPMLMRVFGIRFRFGAEYGTFSFKNYLPVGGEYSGSSIIGLLSFPAGPGQVKVGFGRIGSFNGFMIENSYGFGIGNVLGMRVGIRSTTGLNVQNSLKTDLGTTSWMDGFVSLGFNL